MIGASGRYILSGTLRIALASGNRPSCNVEGAETSAAEGLDDPGNGTSFDAVLQKRS